MAMTRDAASALFYSAAARDCSCGCDGHTTPQRDALAAAALKVLKTADAARKAQAQNRAK